MTKEIRAFLDDVFSYEDVVPMTRQECAANIQYWREDGVEVPEKLRSDDLFCYLNERIEAAKKAEMPLKTYKIRCTETLVADFYVEAHNADEADAIFQAWEEDDGAFDIRDRLIDSSEGWKTEFAVETVPLMSGFDIPYESGKNYLPKK